MSALLSTEYSVLSTQYAEPEKMSDLRAILEMVRSGTLTVDDAASRLHGSGVAELGLRASIWDGVSGCGFPEVIFCQGKTSEWVEGVVRKPARGGEDVLATRVSEEQSAHLALAVPGGGAGRVARTFWLPAAMERPATSGRVFVLTAGTSDLPVAREAVVTARRAARCRWSWTWVSQAFTDCCGTVSVSAAPTPSSLSPAWTGRCPVSSAGWSIAL
jgi:hypothetical protein